MPISEPSSFVPTINEFLAQSFQGKPFAKPNDLCMDGKLLAYRETPEDTVTNYTFGGADLKSLYVACGTLLLRIPTQIPGTPFIEY